VFRGFKGYNLFLHSCLKASLPRACTGFRMVFISTLDVFHSYVLVDGYGAVEFYSTCSNTCFERMHSLGDAFGDAFGDAIVGCIIMGYFWD
jgi:hypothetical protein